jgi:hypothetical protein
MDGLKPKSSVEVHRDIHLLSDVDLVRLHDRPKERAFVVPRARKL